MTGLPSFAGLNRAFHSYIHSFPADDRMVLDHFMIKKTHTFRVIREITLISKYSGLSEEETGLARIIALFHDIGRFEQFTKYGTFNDDISENHAAIAIRVLHQQHFFSGFSDKTVAVITAAILQHNIPTMPETGDPDGAFYARLLRDADKLDIWRLTLHQNVAFTIRTEEEASCYTVPDAILNRIREHKIVFLQYAESMNDFRLLRLSWLFDMNFPATFSIIGKRGYIDKILAKIPDFPEKKEVASILHAYCRLKA